MPHTLFFALFPDAAALDRIAATADLLQSVCTLRGRRIARARLHLTWHFIGRFAKPKPDVEARALVVGDRVSCPTFIVSLDRACTFERERASAPCVFEGSTPPALLLSMAATRRSETSDATARPDHAFRSHVTWLYSPDRIPNPQSIAPIAWCADEFAFVRSARDEPTFHILRRWPLA